MSRLGIACVAGLAFVAITTTLPGDTIKLEGGGSVKGQILDEKSTKDYVVIKSLAGGEVKVERQKIQEIIREKTALQEYEEIKGQYQETAEDQFRLAMWCESHRLLKQRKEHLQKVIELDPDHAQAREKLGYLRRDGKWLTPKDLKEAKGLVRYQGRYITPQEKEILEQKRRVNEEEKEWHARIKMWKIWVTGNDVAKARQGEEKLREIEDPQALEAVLMHFGKENAEPVRVLMCDILGNIPGEQATLELVKRCIIDVSPNVRWAAVDKLAEREDATAVRSLIRILTSEHNTVVRRAAEALGAIGDASAVPALIDALVTKHKQVVTRPGPVGSFMGTQTPVIVDYEPVVAPGVVAFRPVIGMQAQGAGFGSTVQEVVVVPVENQEVHEALVKITEEDFGYNQAAWRAWLATQRRKEEIKKRR